MPATPTSSTGTGGFPASSETTDPQQVTSIRFGTISKLGAAAGPMLNPSQQHQLDKLRKSKVELTFAENTKARSLFMAQTNEYLTSNFQLRTVLSEMGLYPSDQELTEVLSVLNNKVDFPSFVKYLTFLKVKYLRPEPKDTDTVRAFAALGGSIDRQGNISVDLLRESCKKFALTIDIDAMIKQVDEDSSGVVDFDEFKAMWEKSAVVAPSLQNTGSAPPSANGNSKKQQQRTSNSESANGDAGSSGQNALEILQSGGGRRVSVDDTFADEMMEMIDESDDGESLTLDAQLRRLRERHSPTKNANNDVEANESSGRSPRPLVRKQSAILRSDGEGDERDMLAILHHYLCLPDRNSTRDLGKSQASGRRQSMQRRASQRKSLARLPSIGRTNSVLVNSAAAAAAAPSPLNDINTVSDEEGDTSPTVSPLARRGARGRTTGAQPAQSPQSSNTGGYRAPSPVILSQYSATKGRADAKLSPAKGPRPPPRTPRGTIYAR